MSDQPVPRQTVILFKTPDGKIGNYTAAYTREGIEDAIADCEIRYGTECNARAVEAGTARALEQHKGNLY